MAYRHIALIGNLTDNPKRKELAGDKVVATFSVAQNQPLKGEAVVDFSDVEAWGSLAEFICRNFTKGSRILVSGKWEWERYVDKAGEAKRHFKVIAQDVDFAGSSKAGQEE